MSDTCLIPLSQNLVAFVDEEDYLSLIQFEWYALWQNRGRVCYAVRSGPRDASGNQEKIRMHRQILNAAPAEIVDHRDLCGLNNRKYNLRIATHAQNLCNRGPDGKNTSGFKGVSFMKSKRKWYASINIGGKRHFLGYRNAPEECAVLYDAAAKIHHGEFAWLNFQ